jgi:hypothetical protein
VAHRQIMVAKSNAMVRTPDHGPRLKVVKDVTTAEDNADIVRTSPHLWVPLKVDYRGPQDSPPDEVGDLAKHQGLPYLDQLRRLCVALEGAGVAVELDDDGAVMAGNVVDAALRELGLLEGEGEPDATPRGRAKIREWATSAGIEVAQHGKLPVEVVQRYKDAHSV